MGVIHVDFGPVVNQLVCECGNTKFEVYLDDEDMEVVCPDCNNLAEFSGSEDPQDAG